MTTRISQFSFSFYRHRPVHCDFSGGQITGEAGLLPLRAFDERHHLTRDCAALLRDPRQDERVRHEALALLRQRLYQIVAGYEDANDADRLRHDPTLQIVANRKLGEALGSQPTLSRWENAPSGREIVRLNDALVEQFIRLCGQQVRQHGEILLDIDTTDDLTHGQQQLSFFNGAYGQHMYHPMLIFERHTGSLLAARLRPGNAPVMLASCPCFCVCCRVCSPLSPGCQSNCAAMPVSLCPCSTSSASSSASSTPSAFPPICRFCIGLDRGDESAHRAKSRAGVPVRQSQQKSWRRLEGRAGA